MKEFEAAEPNALWMLAIWVLSGCIAVVFIWITIQANADDIILPPDFDAQVAGKDLLLGSSLSRTALPADDDQYVNVLSSDRATQVAGLPAISEAHSISLLKAGVAAGAPIVLLEVNAFAHEFNGLRNQPLATTMAGKLSDNGKRLTQAARAAVGLPAIGNANVKMGRISATQHEFGLARTRNTELFPRSVWDTSGWEQALADARRQGTRVMLFWPPLPEGGFGQYPARYAEMNDHIHSLALQYGLPLWTSAAPWPDDSFMDKYGHLNAKGRKRFATEISAWIRSL